MSHGDLMKDPFYAGILFEIERKLHEADRLASARGLCLTDSQVRSALVKAVNTARGRPPAPASAQAGEKERLLLELGVQLESVRANIFEQRTRPDATTEEVPLPTADWVKALAAVRESCELRSGREPGSRAYLDFLRGFIAEAHGQGKGE